MDSEAKRSLLVQCLRYVRSDVLPSPLPSSAEEYRRWRRNAKGPVPPDEDAEEAWADLYSLVEEQPATAWELICAIAAQCRTEWECATLSAGPLENFVGKYGPQFRREIEHELSRNEGFRMAYKCL
jgi:hypothetical protein